MTNSRLFGLWRGNCIILLTVNFIFLGCWATEADKRPECTLESILQEVESLSNSRSLLDTIFHLDEEEMNTYFNSDSLKIMRLLREEIMIKFIARLNDENRILTHCKATDLLDLRVGDMALYCLAKAEPLPFGLATGRQNCTEPWVSKDITLPTNFIYYSSFERERLTHRYLKYYFGPDRKEFLSKGENI